MIRLVDDLEVHFLELTKLGDVVPKQGGLANWLFFLKGMSTEYWEVLKVNEPGLEKAMDTLQYLSRDSETRRLYEARQKYLHDEASMLESAKRTGIREGVQEVAQNMLTLNMDLSTIVQATGLSEQEILALKR